MKDYLIIIPAYNEEKNIGRVLDGMRHFRENTIIINDGSVDHTSQIIKEKGFFVLTITAIMALRIVSYKELILRQKDK